MTLPSSTRETAEWPFAPMTMPHTRSACARSASASAGEPLAITVSASTPASAATRFATRGEHNLVRARGQWRLAESVRAQRDALDAIVRRVFV